MSEHALPPPVEPVADAVHAMIAGDATLATRLGGAGAVPADGRVERGGSALLPDVDRESASPVGRMAVRIANLPDAPGYVGAPSAGDTADRGWVRVELRVAATDRPGAPAACRQALRRALSLLLLKPIALADDDVEAVSRIHRHAGPSPALFDPEAEDWTASAVVEVLVRSPATGDAGADP